MKKQIRRKLIVQQLVKKLDTYERRIRQMAENAYRIRQFIQTLDTGGQDLALHSNEEQGSIGGGSIDNGTGGADISDSTVVAPVLEEQPAELSSDSGNPRLDSGSAV